MPAIERVIPIVGQISDPIREMLARRMREITGLALLTLSCVAAAALMTWSVQDPSLSHATSGKIRNIMGWPGAIGADLAMQILGLGAIMLILPIAMWGWRLVTHRHFDRQIIRLACWILCAIIGAGFASCWPHSASWPLPTGLGGVVGDALVRTPAVVFGPPGFFYRLVLGTILLAAMITTCAIASGVGSREKLHAKDRLYVEEDFETGEDEDGDEGRGAISLGLIVHAALSAKARLTLLVARIMDLLLGKRASPAFERREPEFGAVDAAFEAEQKPGPVHRQDS